jgi:hypothetical protein
VSFEADVDSRNYRFAFPVDDLWAIPPDFEFHPGDNIQAGLFLPRDDPDWFGRRSYPPRLLLLYSERVLIVSHPESNKPLQGMELADLIGVESAHVLLLGSMRLIHSDGGIEIRYNRRDSGPVERWLGALRDLIHGGNQSRAVVPNQQFGDTIDFKFHHALTTELAQTERLQASWFSPPSEAATRCWIFSRNRVQPGNLLALTAHRVLWITDKVFKSYERYGYTARYARLSELEDVLITASGDRALITIAFRRGEPWVVPIPAHSTTGATAFAEAANQVRHRQAMRL